MTDKEDVVGGRGRAAGWPETGSGGGPGVRAAEGGRVKSKREWSGLSVVCVASSFRKYSLIAFSGEIFDFLSFSDHLLVIFGQVSLKKKKNFFFKSACNSCNGEQKSQKLLKYA